MNRKVCTIIFSKDRPAQLDLVLRSYGHCCKDPENSDIYVLYKPTSSRFESLYRQCEREHPTVRMVREVDFAADVLNVVAAYEFVCFVVDDTIFIRPFSFASIIGILDHNKKTIGASLRLGKNTSYCYMLDRNQAIPEMHPFGESGLNGYEWIDAECDFGYPLELSSSVYRVPDMLGLIQKKQFSNPNTMENCLVEIAEDFKDTKPILICHDSSAAFSVPLNLVQTVCGNRAGASDQYGAVSMARAYARGERLSFEELLWMAPSGCHQEVALRFVAGAELVPEVSVIIPCYKQAAYLKEAVESVKRQTFKDWEIIIINDGSPDNTDEVANEIIAESNGHDIKLMNIRNQGLAMARNAGIEMARGAYILCLDSDDRLTPSYMRATYELLESDSTVGIAYTDLQQFGDGSELIQAAEFDPERLPIGNQLNYCALYRREIWEDVGGYNPNLTYGYEDWDFWVGCVERGYVAKRIPGALFEYRIKESSMFTVASRHDSELRARIVVNHPRLYKNDCEIEARSILASDSVKREIPNAPKITVIIPTFRRPFRLMDALSSLAKQRNQDFEALVVDDGGFDVRFVVNQFRDRMQIRLLRHAENRGVSAARNTGLRFARGQYVVYLDDDDIYYDNHLNTLVEYLESSGKEVAYTDSNRAIEVMVDGQYIVQSKDVLYSNDWDNDLILAANLVPVLCVMHELRCVMRAGFFDESLKTHEDWDFWIRLSRDYSFHHIKDVTCEFRERKDETSTTGSSRADFLKTAETIIRKYRSHAKGKKDVARRQKALIACLRKELGTKRKSLTNWIVFYVLGNQERKKNQSGTLVMKFE